MRRPSSLVLVAGRPMVPPALVDFFHRRLQPDLDQRQEVPIADPAGQRLQELGVRDAIEVTRSSRRR